MSTFVLIPGAGGVAWYWHRLVPLLEARGHAAIAVDLPGDDETAGLPEYAAIVGDALDDESDVVLVAQSLGGFTAPLVAGHPAVRALVMVNAMIPEPGERPGGWWANTGAPEAREAAATAGGYPEAFDIDTYFLHDVPPEVSAAGGPLEREESDAVFDSACTFHAWPAVPTHVVAGADDRLFPPAFQQAVAASRLGADIDVLPGGHLIALARPVELAEYLAAV